MKMIFGILWSENKCYFNKNFIRLGSRHLDEKNSSDFIQTEVDEIRRCTYLGRHICGPQLHTPSHRVSTRPETSKSGIDKAEGCTQHLASNPTQRHCPKHDNMDSNTVV